MVSIPDDLLTRVDEETRRRGMTRSALIRTALSREVGEPDQAAARRAVERIERSRARFSRVGAFDSAELIRAERDARDARDRGRAGT